MKAFFSQMRYTRCKSIIWRKRLEEYDEILNDKQYGQYVDV